MKKKLLLFLITGLLLLFVPKTTWGAVTLKYFQAEWNSSSQQVALRWETATELDNLGFQVRKKINGSTANFAVVKLCPKATGCAESEKIDFVFAAGETTGKLYGDFFDNEVQAGTNYLYQLVSYDTSQREEIAETREVSIPATTSLTATPSTTPTSVVSPTASSRQGNSNNRRTPTPIPPTASPRPIQPTFTPPLPATSQPPTATLEPTMTESAAELTIPTLPLPSITLIFPHTPTSVPVEPSETPPTGTIPQNASWFTPARLFVIGLIVLIWVILGGWFLFTLRKLQ